MVALVVTLLIILPVLGKVEEVIALTEILPWSIIGRKAIAPEKVRSRSL